MKNRRLLRATLSLASGIALCEISGTAVADGLKSQYKSHVPFAPGIVKVLSRSELERIHNAPPVSNPVSDEEIIGMIVRRNLRAAKRRSHWFGLTSEPIRLAKAEAKLPVNKGNRVDRNRLILRGNQTVPDKCSGLHTHDRSVCLHELQLQKMIRLEGSRK